MKSFKYTRAIDPANAARSVSANASAKFLAGGTNLIDLMKEYVERPDELVDITRLNSRRSNPKRAAFNRRVGEKYRHGKSSARPPKLSALNAGDLSGRVGAAA
jgi:CO/xanthine dehydrogenase FAD-binding subunit